MQHDYDVANGPGAAVRSDMNALFAAIVSQNSGATEPTTMFAYQFWADTTTGILKQRNYINTAWINLYTIATGAWLGNSATVSVSDAASDTTTWPMLAGLQTGNQAPATDAGLSYNASTNTLTVAQVDGNASTAGIPQNSKSAAYTTVLADANKHILHPTTDNNARTFTIDSNADVAYAIGTTITFVNQINTLTIAITADTMTLAGLGTTGSRTLNASGMATAIKVASTSWVITGSGLS
jgi:hypothetical protein